MAPTRVLSVLVQCPQIGYALQAAAASNLVPGSPQPSLIMHTWTVLFLLFVLISSMLHQKTIDWCIVEVPMQANHTKKTPHSVTSHPELAYRTGRSDSVIFFFQSSTPLPPSLVNRQNAWHLSCQAVHKTCRGDGAKKSRRHRSVKEKNRKRKESRQERTVPQVLVERVCLGAYPQALNR